MTMLPADWQSLQPTFEMGRVTSLPAVVRCGTVLAVCRHFVHYY
jgi:hypothetical protein